MTRVHIDCPYIQYPASLGDIETGSASDFRHVISGV